MKSSEKSLTGRGPSGWSKKNTLTPQQFDPFVPEVNQGVTIRALVNKAWIYHGKVCNIAQRGLTDCFYAVQVEVWIWALRRCEMSARSMSSGSAGGPAKGVSAPDAVGSAKPDTRANVDRFRRPTPNLQPTNGETIFNAKAFLARAGLGKKILNLKKNEMAFAQGDPADAIFYVRKGRLRVTVTSANGKEATITLVSGGEFLGEECMASAHPLRLATATAMTECELLRVSKAGMVRALHQEHALSDVFVSFLLARNARIQADLVDQLFNSSEKRLARILLLLAQFGKESKPDTVIPKISQEMLAEMIGTTRSRVSFFMNRFRKLGFIEYDGEIRIHNTLLNIFLQESA
ncbi:MAG: Crp/Fnr family transcriptional regulator [Candidatus Korobacteraceae bacterium]